MNCPKCGAFNPLGSNFCGGCGDELKDVLPAAAPVLETAETAAFKIRVEAFLLDLIFIYLLDFLIKISLFGWKSCGSNNLLYSALFILYFWYFGAVTGQTPGKMLQNIKVVRNDGGRVGFSTGLFRAFLQYIGMGALLVGLLMAAFRKDKKTLHDLLVGTKVIKTK